jgi:hypothetical protein
MVAKKIWCRWQNKLSTLQTGVYYSTLGQSNQEIAALSRSSHQSQVLEVQEVEVKKQNTWIYQWKNQKVKSNIFEGIDTSWNRVKGEPIGELLAVISQYDFSNPSASIPNLAKPM